MNLSTRDGDTFASARRLFESGRIREAEQMLRRLAVGDDREAALTALVELYSESQQTAEVINTLVELTDLRPDELKYFAYLGSYLDRLGQQGAAIRHYSRLLSRNPEIAAAHYNIALLYKKMKRYQDALTSYEKAVGLGIDGVEEVYSNMGVLYSEMRRADDARTMYERAIDVDPKYTPALFNLAGLHEESGNREAAIALYRRILDIEPRHWDALARLAQAQPIDSLDDTLIRSLENAVDEATDNVLAREALYFALGHVLDRLDRYDGAFAAYKAANELGKLRNPSYNRRDAQQATEILTGYFTAERVRSAALDSEASPIFICGMFRSGSSLVEQMLAAHESVTAGGELEFLSWLVTTRLAPYPQKLDDLGSAELRQLADDYLAGVHALFPGAKNFTDKKPDNFLHLGLVRILFPRARIIYTRRNKLDNCLSIYFQQLGGNLGYATDLGDIAHYYELHDGLMKHWQDCFGGSIFSVDYDELVRAPEPILRSLFDYLDLEWDDRCLDFQHAASPVKTASVWQVRQELHSRSSGRWENYRKYLSDLLPA